MHYTFCLTYRMTSCKWCRRELQLHHIVYANLYCEYTWIRRTLQYGGCRLKYFQYGEWKNTISEARTSGMCTQGITTQAHSDQLQRDLCVIMSMCTQRGHDTNRY